MTEYEQFNERVFEAYCKKSIGNAVLKERQRKAARSQVEQPFSTLTDNLLFDLPAEEDWTRPFEEDSQIVHVRNMSFPVRDQRLAHAISYLMPRDREIILLYFFGGLKDEEIAQLMEMSRPTVSRRRKAAVDQLRELMEDTT